VATSLYKYELRFDDRILLSIGNGMTAMQIYQKNHWINAQEVIIESKIVLEKVDPQK